MEFPKPLYSSAVAISQALAKFQRDESGALRWIGTSGAIVPNATFTITRQDTFPNVAPCAMSLRATGFTDFVVTEPTGDTNVYDPVQHRITVIWFVDDDAYTRISPVNLPDQWKDPNVHYGTAITHVIPTGGRAYTFTAFAFDDAGNWGTATFTTPTIQTRSAAFSDAATIYYSAAGNFTEVPGGVPGANRVTNWADVVTRADALDNSSITPRIVLRRDEVYANHPQVTLPSSIARGAHIGAYGSGTARPRIETSPTVASAFGTGSGLGYLVMEEIEFIGGWDSTTETGPVIAFMDIVFTEPLMFHRCRISGYNTFDFGNDIGLAVMSDCEITSGKKFTLTHATLDTGFMAIVNCALHCHVDALNGGSNGNSNPESFDLGNMHHVRCFGGTKLYVAMTSSFSRVGWSSNADAGSNVFPGTDCQAAWRDSSGGSGVRWRKMYDRVTFEGGTDVMLLRSVSTPGTRVNGNIVFDKVLFCATVQTTTFLQAGHNGITLRNCYFVRPDIGPMQISATPFGNGLLWFRNITAVLDNPEASCRVFNCTAQFLGTSAQLNGADPVFATATTGITLAASNNLYHAPSLTTPRGTGVSGEPNFLPFTQPTLTGFVPQFKGTRWNFRAVGWSPSGGGTSTISCGQARFNETGVNQDVPVGAWVRLPWPNMTGQCNGAGNNAALTPVAPSTISGLPSQKHLVMVGGETFSGTNNTRHMHDGAIFPGTHNNKILFDFTNAGGIRIQNNSGVVWPAAEPILCLLDLAPFLMAHKPGTANPATLAGVVPGTGSAGIVPDRTNGVWALDGFLTDYRQGARTPPSGNFQGGKTHKQGAFA
jgi:hypothetical protein